MILKENDQPIANNIQNISKVDVSHGQINLEDNIIDSSNQNQNGNQKCKNIIIVILVLFCFFFFTNHPESQNKMLQVLQQQDNLPQTKQEKASHPKDLQLQSHAAQAKKNYDQSKVIQINYHSSNPKSNKQFQFYQKRNLPSKCSDYLPYNIFQNPPKEYYHWFGKVGRSLYSSQYQSGHLYERHVAVGQKCTKQQKIQNKTVFLNMIELSRALQQVSFVCNLHDHKKFQFSQNGRISTRRIRGIDCKNGQFRQFEQYFILYKRGVHNEFPSQDEYMTSMFTTLWTFYPKR